MRKQNGGEDTAEFKAVNARYVKFQGIKRVMGYGYSIWEFEVYAQQKNQTLLKEIKTNN